jgi:hypothetical protein
MSALYELTGQFQQLLQMVEDGEYEYQDLVDTFESIEGEIEYKADGYAKVIKEIEGNVATIKTEIDRLSNKKSVLENSIKTLKQTLEKAMIDTGKTKFKTELFSFGIQKNPARLVINGQVPNEFLIPQEPKVDNSKIKDLLKSQELEFAHLEQSESLRIR